MDLNNLSADELADCVVLVNTFHEEYIKRHRRLLNYLSDASMSRHSTGDKRISNVLDKFIGRRSVLTRRRDRSEYAIVSKLIEQWNKHSARNVTFFGTAYKFNEIFIYRRRNTHIGGIYLSELARHLHKDSVNSYITKLIADHVLQDMQKK